MGGVHSVMQGEQEVCHVVRRFIEADYRSDIKSELDSIDIQTRRRGVQKSIEKFWLPLDSRTLEKKVVFPGHDREVSRIKGKTKVEAPHANSRVGQ